MTETNSVEEASFGVEIQEGHVSGLAKMKEEIYNITTVGSGEPADGISASIFNERSAVEEVQVGLANSMRLGRVLSISKRQLKLQCLAHLILQSRKGLQEYWNKMRPLLQEPHKTIIHAHPIAQMEREKLPIIFRDLLQCGNQIPYLVLEGLFEMCYPLFQIEKDNIFVKKRLLNNIIGAVYSEALGIGHNYVKRFSSDPERFEKDFGFGSLKPVHLLDLIQSCLVPSHLLKQDAPRDDLEWGIPLHGNNIPSISKLRRAGIKVNLQDQGHFLEVTFRAGVIKMPRIILNELMCTFLENCVAFEHLYKGTPKRISSFVLLLDCLVDTADDVSYLRERRVHEHYKVTDADAAEFINSLGKRIAFDGIDSNFFKLCNDVNKHYEKRLHQRWVWLYQRWASFKREYFDKPWLLISVFAGLILLILTCLQTYYTIKPRK